jgi:hypothetical protein
MRKKWSLLLGIAGLTIWSQLLFAQIPTNPPNVVSVQCTNKPANPDTLAGTPDAQKSLLSFGAPCQETVPIAGPGTVLQNLQHGFDFYSWLTFIALNSPRDGSSIETAKSDTPTKWEGMWEDKLPFIQLTDVMRTDVKDPSKQPRVIPVNCQAQYKPGMMVINMIEETYNQPFKTGPLIDQRDNYALFDILMNKDMFDFIVKHGLYSKAQQGSAENSRLKIDFPAGDKTGAGTPGAIMIKVAWKIITPEDDNSKFHTVDALVSMPDIPGQTSDPPCLHKTLGLVGFHVAHKTTSRLQWIWTSFEHVDNVPDKKEIDTNNLKSSYNFYDRSCDPAKCPVNGTPERPWLPDRALQLKFKNSFNSQIVRVIPIDDDTRLMNEQFQAILGINSVWRNYQLISTQWPSDFNCAKQTNPPNPPNPPTAPAVPATEFEKQPDMTCAPAPTFLANSTLETFSQGATPLASSSCMACHGNAVSHQKQPPSPEQQLGKDDKFFNQSDFTFMLEKAN